MTYTVNRIFGIGEIKSVNEEMATVFFIDEEIEKTLLLKFIPQFDTIEEAEIALNPESTEEILAKIEAEKVESKNQTKAMHRLEEINIASSNELKRNL